MKTTNSQSLGELYAWIHRTAEEIRRKQQKNATTDLDANRDPVVAQNTPPQRAEKV